MRLIKAEFRKITSTHVWWILLLVLLVFTALALWVNVEWASLSLRQSEPPVFEGMDPAEIEQARAEWAAQIDRAGIAANLYTSGQYFGLLLTMVFGILLVTNEYFHQTATSTFLVAPWRNRVVFAKLVTAMSWGVGMWLITTVLSLPLGAAYLASHDISSQLDQWAVIRSILLNLLAYTVWAVFGVGLGTLLRSQIGAVVTALVLYLIGTWVARIGFLLLAGGREWLLKLQVLVPSVASELMTKGVELPGNPPQWLGGVVLLGYAVIAGGIGMAITQRRDIS